MTQATTAKRYLPADADVPVAKTITTLAWLVFVLGLIGGVFVFFTMGYVVGDSFVRELRPAGAAIAVAMIIQSAVFAAALQALASIVNDSRTTRDLVREIARVQFEHN